MEETVAKPGLFKKRLPATLVGVEQEGPIHAHLKCGDSRLRLSAERSSAASGELTLARTADGGCAHMILADLSLRRG